MRISDWSSDVCSSDLGEHGDLASALDRMHVLVQQVVAIPGREVHRLDADLAGRRAAQLVVVAEVGVADPLRRAGAAFAAKRLRGCVGGGSGRGGGKRFAAVEAGVGGPGVIGVSDRKRTRMNYRHSGGSCYQA